MDLHRPFRSGFRRVIRNLRTHRGRGLLAAAALATALPLVLAGCGSSGSSSDIDVGAPASSSPAATVSGATNLKIVVDDGAGKISTWTLTCDPPGGTHPHPVAACTALTAKGRTALPPVRRNLMCSQIYGGPQTATVTGTWVGKPVDSTFRRSNGCQVNRWTSLQGLLPVVPPARVG